MSQFYKIGVTVNVKDIKICNYNMSPTLHKISGFFKDFLKVGMSTIKIKVENTWYFTDIKMEVCLGGK